MALSLLEKLEKAGFESRTIPTTLWEEKKTIDEGIDASELDIRPSKYSDDAAFVVLRLGERLQNVGFMSGRGLDPQDYTILEDGKVNRFKKSELRDVTLRLVVAKALRDDDEKGISEGDEIPKFVVE